MATYTIFSDAADGYIQSYDSTAYSAARAGTGSGVLEDTSGTLFRVGQVFTTLGFYYNYEGFLSFDTSIVAGIVTSVTLSVWCNNDFSTTDFTINTRAYDWGASLTMEDYVAGGSLSNNALRASKTTAGISTTAYTDLTSDSSFASNIANPVRLLLCSNRAESNTTPTGNEYVILRSADYAGTNSDPKLTIITRIYPYVSIYQGTVTASGTDGTKVTGAAPLKSGNLQYGTTTEGSAIKCAVRAEPGLQPSNDGSITITPTGTTASKWALAPDSSGSPGTFGAYGAALTLTSVTDTNKIFWAKAKVTSDEVNASTDLTATLQVPQTVTAI